MATPDWYTPEEAPTAPVAAAPASPVASSASPDWYEPEPVAPPTPPGDKGLVEQFLDWRQKNFDNIDNAIRNGTSAAGNIMMGPEPGLRAPVAVATRAAGAVENPAITRALDQQGQFAQTPVGQFQAPAEATVSAMGAPASPAQIGGNVINKATDFLAREKAVRGAAFDAVEAPFLAKQPAALPGDRRALPTPEGMPAPKDHPDVIAAARQRLQNTLDGINESTGPLIPGGAPAVAGAPSRSFSEIAAGSAPEAAPVTARAELPQTTDFLTKPSEGPNPPAVVAQLQRQLNDSKGTLPYADLKAWRSRVGEAIDGLQGGEGTGQLKQLYKSMSKDMEGHLQANGGDAAVQAFRDANEGFADLQDFVKGHVGNLTNGTVTPEGVYGSLAANPAQSATRLQALVDRGVLDQNDIGGIARNWLQRAGTNAEGHYDPVQLSRAVTKLQSDSPEAFNLLFRQGGRSDAFDAGMAQANKLAAVQSSVAKANAPEAGRGDALKRLAKAATFGTLFSHVPVVGPHVGELAGTLLGLGEGAAPKVAGNPLYQIPKVPFSATGFLKALAAKSTAPAGRVGSAAARATVRALPAEATNGQ